MYILGFSAFYHDSAAALIKDGVVLYAAQEERFSRKKNDSSFPLESIRFLLKEEGLSLDEIDHVIFYDKPWLKFERIIETILNQSPRSLGQFMAAMPSWLGERLNFRKMIKEKLKMIEPGLGIKELLFSEHHFSHAASAFYTSPFQEACVICIDGVGEWATLTIYEFESDKYRLIKQMNFPDSIGILYSAFTYFCGFKINSGEYKLMGLAPYGKLENALIIKNKIKSHLYTLFDDGSIRINLSYFKYQYGNETIAKEKWQTLFGLPAKDSESQMTQEYCDFALGAQLAIEEILLSVVKHAGSITKSNNLCLSGGVALNCVANAKIQKQGVFKNIWIHPAPGDAGGAIGAALGFYYSKEIYNPVSSFSPYLGPRFSLQDVERALKKFKLNYEKHCDLEVIEMTADSLADNQVVGWFQDRMEWGPRALGNRSILASPIDANMQSKLNQKIKKRESFRPFAPVVLESKTGEYFVPDLTNPYMQFTHQVKNFKESIEEYEHQEYLPKLSQIESPIPAGTHLDGSARVQTVNANQNLKLANLLAAFEKRSNLPILINTSFNVRGEPIVCTPEHAVKCFLSTDMDLLVIENFVVHKNNIQERCQDFATELFEKD